MTVRQLVRQVEDPAFIGTHGPSTIRVNRPSMGVSALQLVWLAAVRGQFVAQFMITDMDFDGHADLAGVREFGAKWARYCVWLYDPKQHIYVKDLLAEQME